MRTREEITRGIATEASNGYAIDPVSLATLEVLLDIRDLLAAQLLAAQQQDVARTPGLSRRRKDGGR